MTKFKVGDKITVIEKYKEQNFENDIGTIIQINRNSILNTYPIRAKFKHGYNIYETKEIKLHKKKHQVFNI